MLLFLKDKIFLATEKFDPWTMYLLPPNSSP